MVQNFKKGHLAQHIESLYIDTSNFTELNYVKLTCPIELIQYSFDLLIKYNLYLYNFEFKVVDRFDSPTLSFWICGDIENIDAYKKENGTVNPTEEEIEAARIRDENDPNLAEFFTDEFLNG